MILRVLTHALAIFTLMHLVSILYQPGTAPGVDLLIQLLSPAGYIIFALATAAALHLQRAFTFVLLLGILIGLHPFGTRELAIYLTPLGLGVLTGTGCRALIADTMQHHAHPVDTNARPLVPPDRQLRP